MTNKKTEKAHSVRPVRSALALVTLIGAISIAYGTVVPCTECGGWKLVPACGGGNGAQCCYCVWDDLHWPLVTLGTSGCSTQPASWGCPGSAASKNHDCVETSYSMTWSCYTGTCIGGVCTEVSRTAWGSGMEGGCYVVNDSLCQPGSPLP